MSPLLVGAMKIVLEAPKMSDAVVSSLKSSVKSHNISENIGRSHDLTSREAPRYHRKWQPKTHVPETRSVKTCPSRAAA